MLPRWCLSHRNSTGTTAGLAKHGLPTVCEDAVGSPGHQGQNAAGPLERRGQAWKRGAQRTICSLHFLCFLPIFAFFFLLNRLASSAQLFRPPGRLPRGPRAPSSTSSPGPLSWLNWLCQELGGHGCVNHTHQRGCEFIVSLQLPQRIHSIPYCSRGHTHGQYWPHSQCFCPA